jgi:cobalt-zinc-cadmium resistance protein CzcA
MINRIISFALRFRAAVIAAVLLLVIAGSWAFATINLDAFPDLTPNQVLVMTNAPGLSANEVENLISYPMETELLGLPGIEGVRSISKPGVSVVTVTFEDDVDFYFARAQVQQRMQDAVGDLAGDFQPMLGPPSTIMSEVFQYLVESETLSPIEIRNLQEYTIKPRLRTIPGVVEVNSWGGMLQQFHVLTDPAKLAGYSLTLNDLEAALAKNNNNFGAGYIEDKGERLRVRGLGRVAGTGDIGNVVVATRGGTPIFVRDLATVVIGATPREGAVTRDGKGEALSGTVILLKGANSHRIVQQVTERLEEIRPLLPPSVRIRPFYNQGEVVERTTRTVFVNLVEGALLVTLILFLFLRNVRASLITASVIPLSLLFAFLAMRRFGVSANLMSLGALDFGLIVDASIVMVENFVRKLSAAGGNLARDSRSALIREAAYEVGRPVVFGVCIIIAVYIPIFTLEGLEGRMFGPMAFTVCVAVLGSLLLALTYVPAVATFALAHVHEKPARWFEWVRREYSRALDWSLSHRRAVIGSAFGVLVLALVSVPFLGTEFMPRLDEGSLLIETRRVPTTALGEGLAISHDVELTLHKIPEVSSVVTNLGRPELATETMGLFDGDVYVGFKPRSQWSKSLDEVIEQMDSALAEIPGLDYGFTAPMAMRLEEGISGVRTQLGIKLFGDSLPLLQEKAEEIRAIVEQVPGAEDVSVRVSLGAMQAELELDRIALARYGLNVDDIQQIVQAGIGGVTATEVIDGRRRFPVVVRLSEPYRGTPEAIGRLLIPTPSGGRIALAQVARVNIVEGPETIEHEDGQRFTVVLSNVRGRDLGSFVSDVRREVAQKVKLPSGYFVTYGGQFENQERAMRRLGLIVPLVLLLILAFLYASFGNGRQALLVMLNVPFALVGGIAFLWLRGLNLSLSASVGFIALFGVAVLNGVVLIVYMNELRTLGRSLADAVREAADTRLRPVLMTALVAGVGFLPMAISTSQGAEVQRPLATVVIGGLITSTVLTLIVLPAMYELMEERWPKVAARFSALWRRPRLAAGLEIPSTPSSSGPT